MLIVHKHTTRPIKVLTYLQKRTPCQHAATFKKHVAGLSCGAHLAPTRDWGFEKTQTHTHTHTHPWRQMGRNAQNEATCSHMKQGGTGHSPCRSTLARTQTLGWNGLANKRHKTTAKLAGVKTVQAHAPPHTHTHSFRQKHKGRKNLITRVRAPEPTAKM